MIERTLVPVGKDISLEDYPTSWKDCDDLTLNGLRLSKQDSDNILERSRDELERVQELLWAEDSYALLIVLQGMDAAGKDSIIDHVMSGVNPQGCEVTGFKAPSDNELNHDFMWRCYNALPERGRTGIFNRSYYEEVLVVRVHPELLEKQRFPKSKDGKEFWQERYESINDMERHLIRSGTVILKFFLHESKEEQKVRFLARLNDPDKQWKFSPADAKERGYWDEYMKAYEKMLGSTSTEEAPWYIIPADQKWLARTLVANIITRKIDSLNLHYPKLSEETIKELDEVRKGLNKE